MTSDVEVHITKEVHIINRAKEQGCCRVGETEWNGSWAFLTSMFGVTPLHYECSTNALRMTCVILNDIDHRKLGPGCVHIIELLIGLLIIIIDR